MALKLKQPFAALMLYGKIETRKWDTRHRGDVLICSSLAAYNRHELNDFCNDEMIARIEETLHKDASKTLLGYALCIANLVTTRRMTREDEALCFVSYNPLLFCHIYDNVRPVQPFIYTPAGIQKWKTINDAETLKKIVEV